jgi:hypothetical protein
MCDPKRSLPKENCVVYSFGSHGHFGFEDDLLLRAPWCEVHTFDPTVRGDVNSVDGQDRDRRIQFHNYGIGGANQVTKIGKLKTLSTIISELGHDCIAAIKMDVESSEWSSIAEWGTSSPFPCFRQLMLEVHSPQKQKLQALMEKLEQADLRMTMRDPNILCPQCMEFSFIRYNPKLGYY